MSSSRRALLRLLPGTTLAACLTAAAYLAQGVPGAATLGPLVLALAFGAVLRALAAAPLLRRLLDPAWPVLAPGSAFVAGPLLKLGVVLLGARLDARVLAAVGPSALLVGAAGALMAYLVATASARRLGLGADLGRLIGVGTAICGASAIAAAVPLLHARRRDASLAVAAISLVGTAGVAAFALAHAAGLAAAPLAWMAGASLQEVGQVVAAGSLAGAASADLALLVKLNRVVLLAPTLLLLARVAVPTDRAGAAEEGAKRWPLPPFVLGFLLLGAAVSLGVLPDALVRATAAAGTLATAVAMAGIGLGIDPSELRRDGARALAVGSVAFLALAAVVAAAAVALHRFGLIL